MQESYTNLTYNCARIMCKCWGCRGARHRAAAPPRQRSSLVSGRSCRANEPRGWWRLVSRRTCPGKGIRKCGAVIASPLSLTSKWVMTKPAKSPFALPRQLDCTSGTRAARLAGHTTTFVYCLASRAAAASHWSRVSSAMLERASSIGVLMSAGVGVDVAKGAVSEVAAVTTDLPAACPASIVGTAGSRSLESKSRTPSRSSLISAYSATSAAALLLRTPTRKVLSNWSP